MIKPQTARQHAKADLKRRKAINAERIAKMTFTTDRKTLERLRVNSTCEKLSELCPNGHSLYRCSEPDNVYCAECDMHYKAWQGVSYNPMLED